MGEAWEPLGNRTRESGTQPGSGGDGRALAIGMGCGKMLPGREWEFPLLKEV
jgi:hypothetical protein